MLQIKGLVNKILNALINAAKDSILEGLRKDISKRTLIADKLNEQLFKTATFIADKDVIYMRALKRSRLGNHPGKHDSIGDAMNWVCLLEAVPEGEDLH